MKKTISFILALVMIFSLTVMTAGSKDYTEEVILKSGAVGDYDTYSLTDGEFEYYVSDGSAIVTGYTGTDAIVVIPNSLGGYPVAEIGEFAFKGCTTAENIFIPEGVTSIVYGAFYGCTSLKAVSLPDTVSEIGEAAFFNCKKLTEVTIPEGVTSIVYRAFMGCSSLASITIPANVTNVVYSAFFGCSALNDVTVLDCSTKFEDNVFDNTSILVLTGAKGSFAQDYAEACGIEFHVNDMLYLKAHDFKVSARVDATCTGRGVTKYKCTKCGEAYRVYIEPLGHVFGEVKQVVPSTCTVHGYTVTECLRCGKDVREDLELDPDNHTNIVTDAAVAPTCTTTGLTEGKHCGDCGKVLVAQKTVDALGHDYVGVVTAPTCTEEGYTTYTCSRCHDSYVADRVAPMGHSWGAVSYVWSDDNSTVTATRICQHDSRHVETETVKTTDKVTVIPTTENEGELTYTATFTTNSAFEVQTKKVTLPKLEVKFVDVKEESFYEDPVYWAVTKGITKGTSEDEFSPNAKCTRSQIVTFLYRAAGEPEVKTTKNPFTDVKSNAYYYKAVLWAVENDITKGTSATKFSPNDVCTRGQIVTFMYRAAGQPTVKNTNNPFSDVKPGAYYYNAVLWAVEKGITKGTSDNKFSPNASCTRGQVVTFLYRAEMAE